MTDSKEQIIEKRSRIVGRNLIFATSATASRICDTYTSWVLAGVGATHALVLSNVDLTSAFIAPSSIKSAVILFLIAFALMSVEKFIAIYVAQTTTEHAEIETYAKETKLNGDEIDLSVVDAEMHKATMLHTRWLNKIVSKFYDEPRARTVAQAAQVQYVVAGIAVLFLFASVACLALGMKV